MPSDWIAATPTPVTVSNSHTIGTSYKNNPAFALTNPSATTITMSAVAVTFSNLTVNYSSRTFTIPTPSTPTWYYVTISDPTQNGETSATLSSTCQTSDGLVGVLGYTFIGAIQAIPGGGGGNCIAGGWPNPNTFIYTGPQHWIRPVPSIPRAPGPQS